MLSYKQWQSINESIMPSMPLGVKGPNNLGIVSNFAVYEAKKKSKKKMHDEDMDFEDEDEDVTGDGEMVDASSEKDEPDVDVEGEGDAEEKGGCGFCGKNSKKKSKKNMKKSKKKMWSDEDDVEDSEEVEEDEDLEAAEEETGEDLDGDDEEGEDEEHVAKVKAAKEEGEEEAPMFSKKKSKKKLKKESTGDLGFANISEDDWMQSVRSMLATDSIDAKNGDGWTEYQENFGSPAATPPVDQVNPAKQKHMQLTLKGLHWSIDQAAQMAVQAMSQGMNGEQIVQHMNQVDKMDEEVARWILRHFGRSQEVPGM